LHIDLRGMGVGGQGGDVGAPGRQIGVHIGRYVNRVGYEHVDRTKQAGIGLAEPETLRKSGWFEESRVLRGTHGQHIVRTVEMHERGQVDDEGDKTDDVRGLRIRPHGADPGQQRAVDEDLDAGMRALEFDQYLAAGVAGA
jgi:hypothetical protein